MQTPAYSHVRHTLRVADLPAALRMVLPSPDATATSGALLCVPKVPPRFCRGEAT